MAVSKAQTNSPENVPGPPLDNLLYLDNQRLKTTLVDRIEQVAQLRRDVDHLLHESEIATRENFEITEYMRKELLHKEEINIKSRAALQEEQQRSASDLAAAKQQAESNEKQLQTDAAGREEELGREIIDLKEQVAVVLEYKAKRQFAEDELSALRLENERLRSEMSSQVKELENKHLDRAARLKKGHEEQIDALKRTAELDAEERTDASIQRILTHNQRLTDELAIHIEVTDGLSKDLHELDTDRRRLQRDLEIKSDVERQMASRGALQARSLKEGAANTALLEGNLAALMTEFQTERERLKTVTEQQLLESEGAQSCLQRLLHLKGKELVRIRRLAQEVLSHRSDVESFLLSSIHQVQQAAKEGQKCSSVSKSGADMAKINARVDIKDLSWDDRERVLRLLFMKINSQARQELPRHQLTLQQPFIAIDATLQGSVSAAGRSAIM